MDRGPGIPPTEIGRMKRPFTRLEMPVPMPPGTGLGLAIVRRIARLPAGSLDLSPRTGGGLVATLNLPFATLAPSEISRAASVPPPRRRNRSRPIRPRQNEFGRRPFRATPGRGVAGCSNLRSG